MNGRLSGASILIVEDDYFIATDLQRALRREDAFVIGPFARLHEAMAAIDGEVTVNVAILDVNLGGTMTFPLAERLKAEGIPWLFVTGYDGWSLPDAYRDEQRVAKPFPTHQVVDTLVSLLGRTSI